MRYSCQYSSDGYAIEYAEKFCKLYSDYYDSFSSSGKAWIDGVRKCLQVKLVPFMRPWMNKTCADIKKEALDSHPDCYLRPAPEVPGICSLPLKDMLRIFWLVNFNGGALYNAPVETGLQMLSVMEGCIEQWKLKILSTVQTYVLYITTSSKLDLADIITIVKDIAQTLNWKDNGLRWFPLISFTASDLKPHQQQRLADNHNIKILLTDGKLLNILDEDSHGSQSLDEAVIALSDEFADGKFSKISIASNSIKNKVRLVQFGFCTDDWCEPMSYARDKEVV